MNRRRRYGRGFGSVDQGSYKSKDSGSHEVDEGVEKKDDKKDGGFLSSVMPVVGALGGGGGMGDLCGCANKDKQEEKKKQDELAQKYPYMDCGPVPSETCKEYNRQMQMKREAEFEAWKRAKDQQVSEAMPDTAREKFAFANEIANELKNTLPPGSENLTLAQIYKQYPNEFKAAYDKLKAKYPMFASVPPELALAMNSDIANMKLSEFITRTGDLGGVKKSGLGTAVAVAGGSLIGIAAVGLLATLFLKKK